jgi:hypothetical protein
MQPPPRKPPLGVIYNTSMNRPDAALALALLNGFEIKREARIESVCVNGAGFESAVFCDIVTRFFHPGPPRNGNTELAPGFAAETPALADAPMVKAVVESQYPRSIHKLSDTSLPEAVIRNGVIFNAESVMILSAPATYLAKSLDLLGTKDLYKERVKLLVVVDAGAPQDVSAMRKVLAEWPTPMVFCGRDVGESLLFPAASIEKDFAWSPAHPVVDAYRAYKPMPYDAPAWDLAAAYYAVHPDSGFFKLSDPGTLAILDDGSLKFAPGGAGKVRRLSADPAQHDKILEAFAMIASTKPPERTGRGQ